VKAIRLLAILTLGVCAFAASANAQPSFVGKFTLPYEVRWGQAVLPAGDYSIRMDSLAAMAKVSSASGSTTLYTQLPIIADSEKGGTYLTITTQGDERKVRSLNLPEIGKSMIFAPLTKAERELLAKAGQVQTVPLFAAKK